MQASRKSRVDFWSTAALVCVGYPVTAVAALLIDGEDASWLWPGVVTAAWGIAGIALAATAKYRYVGLGLMAGLILGFITGVILLFVALGLLANEIGYS